jgi:hypothetical protein
MGGGSFDRIKEVSRKFRAQRRIDGRSAGKERGPIDAGGVIHNVFNYGFSKYVVNCEGERHTRGVRVPQPLRNANRSALIVAACVVGMPCGKSL